MQFYLMFGFFLCVQVLQMYDDIKLFMIVESVKDYIFYLWVFMVIVKVQYYMVFVYIYMVIVIIEFVGECEFFWKEFLNYVSLKFLKFNY